MPVHGGGATVAKIQQSATVMPSPLPPPAMTCDCGLCDVVSKKVWWKDMRYERAQPDYGFVHTAAHSEPRHSALTEQAVTTSDQQGSV